MNLYHLKYFIDAAQGGGISEAARANLVSQSAISRAIANLESSLDGKLIEHRQNHFQLTELGFEVLTRGQDIIHRVTSLKQFASEFGSSLAGPLRFACNQAIASRLIGPLLKDIEKNYPQIRIDVQMGNTDQVQEMVDRGIVDFGVVVEDGEVNKRYQCMTVYHGEFIVVVSPSFEGKPLEHLLVSRTKKGGLSQAYFRAYEKAYGKSISPKLVFPSWQVLLDLAIAGFGSALVPRFMCTQELSDGRLKFVKHKVSKIDFSLCTIVSKNRVLPKNAKALLDLLTAH